MIASSIALLLLIYRRAVLIACGAALIACSGTTNVTPAPTSSFPPGTVAAINSAIASWFSTYKAPGVIVGIWVPGKGTFVAARGTDDQETGAPMSLDDHLRIGSVTKTFTVTVLLQLADKKLLRLDDPVGKYLSYVPNGRRITLRMLANMTAGLFNYTDDPRFEKAVYKDPKRVWAPRELARLGLSHDRYFAPGKGWHYSNTNTVLLGLVIERILKEPPGEFFKIYSFQPLGLANTVWPASTALPSPYAHGITSVDGKVIDATHWSPTISFTAGQLVSTLADMKTWAKACATGAQISAELQKQRLDWVKLPPLTPEHTYGLGITYNHGWLGHNGSIYGYNSEVDYLPSQDATIVLLVNSDIPADRIAPVAALFHALTQIVTPDNVGS